MLAEESKKKDEQNNIFEKIKEKMEMEGDCTGLDLDVQPLEGAVLTTAQRSLLENFQNSIQGIMQRKSITEAEKSFKMKENYMNPITGKMGQQVSS